jgi:hypothetical protein
MNRNRATRVLAVCALAAWVGCTSDGDPSGGEPDGGAPVRVDLLGLDLTGVDLTGFEPGTDGPVGLADAAMTHDGGSGITGDTTPIGPPTWSSQLVATDTSLFSQKKTVADQIQLGVANPNAADQLVGVLTFPGSTTLAGTDHVGPGFATEIDSNKNDFTYGMYRTRVQLASCSPTEEVVNGIFTFFNDGKDHDGDGLIDNSEIDIEILCGTPSVLSLTIWSQYTDDNGFRKWTRAVNLETGEISESTDDHSYGVTSKGFDPAFKHPGFFGADTFYEMGFEWHADQIRYFIVLDGQELTLWSFATKSLIPVLPVSWLFNVWHPNEHWFGTGGAAKYPAHDATMRIDWARYWAQ